MIRLDHNRALTQLARKAACGVGDIDKLVVWGNHSPTMFADWTYATAAGRPLSETIADDHWYKEVLIPEIARRGTAIIEARGASSAASAASAAIDRSVRVLDAWHGWALDIGWLYIAGAVWHTGGSGVWRTCDVRGR